MKQFYPLGILFINIVSCQNHLDKTDYQKDLDFVKTYQEVIELSPRDNSKSRIMITPAYQGRVMTSTAGEKSYGWINYNLIKSGKILPHMNAFGGEERLWLSPEGGQFSVYFEKESLLTLKTGRHPQPLIPNLLK